MESSNENRKKQHEFWVALIKKYEKRNLMLEQQILSLQAQLEDSEKTIEQPPLSEQKSICSCNPCTKKSEDKNDDNISTFSLSSTDLRYMSQIKELIDREKEQKLKLAAVQQREFITDAETFKEFKGNDALNNSLLAENNRLTGELNSLKEEMKLYIEKIKGPIARQIEKEKSKNKCLENEIAKIHKSTDDMKQSFAFEIKELKNKLSNIRQELSLISAVNSKLEEELASQNSRCKELEEALVKQKQGEIEIFRTLKTIQQDSNSSSLCNPCGQQSIGPCMRRNTRGDAGDHTKKQFTLTPEDYKRFPCYEQFRKTSDKEKLSKSTDSEKPIFNSCTCQTQKEMKDSSKVQVKPNLLEASATATAETVNMKLETEDTAVEEAVITDEQELREAATEATIKATDNGM